MGMRKNAAAFTLALALVTGFGDPVWAATALEDYVSQSDDAFEYQLQAKEYNLLYTTYIISMTSQGWHSGELQPETWKHWIVVVEPRLLGQYTEQIPFFSLVSTDTAILRIIIGDANHNERPVQASGWAVQLALQNRAVVAELHAVPIGPVAFGDEQEDPDWWDDFNPFKDEDDNLLLRREDSLQARSFDLALETGDFSWALPAPMVKSVVRCMDTIQELALIQSKGLKPVNHFVLSGHSKRGWTAWLTAAIDARVSAIAVLGYDLLNTSVQIDLQESSWTARSPELSVYDDFDLYERFKTPAGQELVNAFDPYFFRDSLDLDILILNGTNDNYSNADSVKLYLDDLVGDTRLYYEPNAGHDIREASGVRDALAAFYRHHIKHSALPQLAWDGLESGSFVVAPGRQPPQKARLWEATNPSERDFRDQAGVTWSSAELAPGADGTYRGTVDAPDNGTFTAYYVELIFDDGGRTSAYSLTTPITVVGD